MASIIHFKAGNHLPGFFMIKYKIIISTFRQSKHNRPLIDSSSPAPKPFHALALHNVALHIHTGHHATYILRKPKPHQDKEPLVAP